MAASNVSQWESQLKLAQTDGDTDAGIELARRIITPKPHDAAAWNAFIQGLIKNEDYDRGLAAVAAWQSVEKHPTAAMDDYRGQIFLAQKHPADAERAWRAAMTLKGVDYLILSNFADFLESRDRWSESLPLRARAASLKPAAALIAAKAGALLHVHQWDAANTAIQKANNLDATDKTVQQWLPAIESIDQTLPQIKALDAQIAAHPKDPAPLLDQAILFTQASGPSLALSNARRALAIAPGSTRARVQAGEAELDLGKPDEAAKFKVSHDLKRAANGHVDPQVLRDLGDADTAVLQDPGKAAPLAARSKVLRKLNQYVLALDDAQAALRIDPNSPDAEFEMGHDLDGLGRAGQALPHIVRATQLRPDDPVAWYYRGVVEANRADFKAAIQSQTRSLALRESAVALQARIDCELRLGLADAAAADSRRLSQLGPDTPE